MRPSVPSRLARVLLASLLLAGAAQAAAKQGEVLGRFVLQQSVLTGGGDAGSSGTTAPTSWSLATLLGYAGVVEGALGEGNGPTLAGVASLSGAQGFPEDYASSPRPSPGGREAIRPPLRLLYCVYRL